MDNQDYLKSEIGHRTDGPVTQFVCISRACKLANRYDERYDSEDVANALYDVMIEYGFIDQNAGAITSNEF